MRKKLLLVTAVLLVLSLPAFAEFRLDLGFDAPLWIGVSSSSGESVNIQAAQFWPIPAVSLDYFWRVGPVDLGGGLRLYSVIVESMMWPNIVAEVNLDPVVIQAQLGGLAFLAFGATGTNLATGAVVIPDLSAWFAFGKEKNLRVGGGIMGIYAPDALGKYMPWIVYLGFHVALGL
jgi:hypothetical protein